MNVRLTSRAKNDLRDIYRYSVENFGQTQAEKYLGGLEHMFDLLIDNPHLGKSMDEESRRYVYKGHYVIYTIEVDTVVIHSIRNTKMELP